MTEDDFDLIMQYSVDLPGYNDIYSTGINLDKAISSLYGVCAHSKKDTEGKFLPISVTEVKRLREAGSIRINRQVHKNLKYTATREDVDRGYFAVAIGKSSAEGGLGLEKPIGVMETIHIRFDEEGNCILL